jgi:hypothetical protein
MDYIPKTQLIKKYVQDLIRLIPKESLGPNQDVMSVVDGDPFIDPNISIDEYWVKLGRECCNLQRWSMYIHMILSYCFGESSKYVTYINKYSKILKSIKDIMDTIVCSYYSSSQYSVEYNGEKIDIIKLFYGNDTITEYPVKYSGEYTNQLKKYKHTLTLQDKQYILTFIDRSKALIEFLENKFDLYNNDREKKTKEKHLLFGIINKFKKLLERENIINEIVVQERP